MFDFVRKHNRIMQFMLFLLVVPSFLLFGIEGYTRLSDKGATVAEVAGRDITAAEWDYAHKQEVDRIRGSNPRVDIKQLDTPQAKYATLERMVRERVLEAASTDLGLATGDQRLRRALELDPTIASMRSADGKLDRARFEQFAGQQGLSGDSLLAKIRADMSVRQVSNGVAATGLATPSVADLNLNLFLERREVQLARFSAVEYGTKFEPTDAELEAYYKEHQSKFQSAEQASVQYVVLDLETVKKSIVLNEADLKTYYEQNLERLNGKEERRASHILIQAAKTAPAEERQKAKARAEELLAAVKKAPESFADLAKKNSQDPGSATNGGELPVFSRGGMVKPFEDAAFALKKGELSGVVESDYGYHIIKLLDVKAPKQRSFDEVRPEIEADLKKQQAQRKFAEVAEVFNNTVYEQSDSFKPVADKLKLEVHSAEGVTRQGMPGSVPVLSNPKLLAALFSADSIEKKRNTEAVEIAPNQLASARLVQYAPARTLPLAEVKAQVKGRLQLARGADLARQDGQAKLKAWQADASGATFDKAVVVSRDKPQNLPATALDAAMRVDSDKLPGLTGVDLGTQGYAIIKVNKIQARDDVTTEVQQGQRNQYGQIWSSAEMAAYYEVLKARFKVKIKSPKPAKEGDAAAG